MVSEKSSVELDEYVLRHSSSVSVYNSGEPIFSQGEAVRGVYYVSENHIRIIREAPNGNATFLWFAKPKELVGLTSFFQNNGQYTCSAIAGEKPCTVVFLTNEAFANLYNQHPRFKQKLLRTLCERIRFMEIRTESILYQNIDKRIIETLLFLATKENSDHQRQKNLRINYTKKELAEMVGASLEYLKTRIRELKSMQLIDYGRGWLSINDVEKLRLRAKA